MAKLHLVPAHSLVALEHVVFTFTALCRASGANDSDVQALVDEGLLHPTGSSARDWQFKGPALPQTRRALRLARELDLSLHAAAIVMDLLDQIEALERRP